MADVDPKKIQNIEKLEKDLYSQDFKNTISPRSSFSHPDFSVDKDWPHEGLSDNLELDPQKTRSSVFKKIFIAALIFFILCAGIAAYAFFYGTNIISADKVDISFVGPLTSAAGDSVSVDVVITNNNKQTLVNPVLYIDYPDGTKATTDITEDLLHEKETLSDLPAGSIEHQSLNFVLFGPQHSIQDVHLKLEYSVTGSNNVFTKEKDDQIEISSTPLTMTISHASQVPSGQPVQFTVNLTSNSNAPLSNLLLQTAYPFGFQFLNATPTPSFDTTSWAIPSLKPGEQKTFLINGLMVGEDGDDRVVRFAIGSVSSTSAKTIATTYLNSAESVQILKSPIALKVSLNNDKASIPVDSQTSGQIQITNNLPSPVFDAQVQVTFSGNAFDPNRVDGTPGLYHAPTKTIIWDKTEVPELGTINPGTNLTLNFLFRTLPANIMRGIKNGTISASATITGSSVSSTNTSTSLATTQTQLVKVQPQGVTLLPRIVYSIGPFKNTGPVPPKAETKTTYTIIWSVPPASDDMTGVSVTALLPSYIQWLGVVSPANENITWDANQHTITWQVDDIPAGQTTAAPREVDFQVEIQPSTSQIGGYQDVVDNMQISGVDNFTQATLNSTAPNLTTNLITDPQFQGQSGIVVK